jgi:hypothetical protein
VKIVERRVEVPVQPLTPSTASIRPRHNEWVHVLSELAAQLDAGAVYDRELPNLTAALNQVLEAFGQRPYVREQARRR